MRILFLKYGSFSHINDSVYGFLKVEYPGYTIDVLDVWHIVKREFSWVQFIINIYFFLKEYGPEIMTGKKRWKESVSWFFATSYISIQTGKYLKRLNHGKKYEFTFQTQSIFNGKIEGIPHFIYTDHTTRTNLLYPDINPKQYMRSKAFIEKSEIKIYQDATMIFTFGSLVCNSLINQYQIPKEKVMTVFGGCNVPHEYVENINKYSSRNILFVGVAWERKGGPIILKTFENILLKYPDATLTIVGCKPENIKISNCYVIGKIPKTEVIKYYNSATVFCLPTRREPFGIVFIEAMNYRIPIVANNIGSIPDLVINDYNGFLINNNVNDYTEAISKLFDDPEKGKIMGEKGSLYAKSKFTWEKVGSTIKSRIDEFL